MSLQVWLPLNGNLNNQGLSNYQVTNTNATINNSGKIGKCYQFGTGQSYLELPKEAMNRFSTECTVSFWIKLLTRNASYETYFQAGLGGAPWSHYIFGLLRNNNSNNCCFTISNGSSSSSNGYTTSDLELNTWYHILLVYKTGHCLIYINGSLYHDYTTTIVPAFNNITTITIGCSNAKNYQTNCLMNDFRIYDEALSPKEIKNISRGLICHYTLNRYGFGQDNLILTSQSVTSGGNASGITRTYESDGTMKIVAASGNGNYASLGFQSNSNTNVGNNLSVGDTYTISVDVKVASGTNLPTLFINSGNSYKQLQGNIVLNQWIRAYYTSVWAEPGSTYGNISLHLGFSSAIGTYYFRNFKLEKGSTATPWTPAPSDDLYSQIGLDSNIENDVSGYGNDGTRIGTFSWSGDTPRYGCSTIFNGIDNAIQTPNLTTMITDKNYTISCWTYKTVIGTKNYQTIYGGPSGFELEARNGSGTDPLFRIYNWGGGTTPYVFGEWTHFCFVHTDSDSKLYINGELKITGSSVNIPSGNYYIGAWKVATSQNYDGLMSDFRIYATALSEDDVLELYHTPISLSNNGTLMTQGEYVEV